MLKNIQADFEKLANPQQAKILQGFFKTGPGDYGEGDIFLGIKVPQIRQLVKKYSTLPLADTQKLLHEPIHEKRLFALLLLVAQFKKSDQKIRQQIFDLYLANTKYINNWDLVDLTAPNIVGPLASMTKLRSLAKSKLLWDKRIAILATFYHIYQKNPVPTLTIAPLLLKDKHDLIHKAVGWMLREVGKRCSQDIEEEFLKKHYKTMPRTMLRYAIERFPEKLRLKYLKS